MYLGNHHHNEDNEHALLPGCLSLFICPGYFTEMEAAHSKGADKELWYVPMSVPALVKIKIPVTFLLFLRQFLLMTQYIISNHQFVIHPQNLS